MSLTTFVCISDTHTYHRQVKLPEGDILLVTGDISSDGATFELQDFARWCDYLLQSEKFQEIVLISGNHDFGFQDRSAASEKLFNDIGVHYLRDSMVTLNGINIYGSPWQPWFHDWAFNLRRGTEIKAKWDLIPDSADVVMTHGPPIFFGDKVDRGYVGCYDLLQRLDELPNLKVHVSGHIHEGYGDRHRNQIQPEWDWLDLKTEDSRAISFPNDCINNYRLINAAVCTRAYKPTNPPLTFTL